MRVNFRAMATTAVVVGGLLVLVASGEETGGAKSDSNGSQVGGGSGASGDVSIKSCGVDGLGQLEAVLLVTNNSSKSSDYMIEVVFESSDGSTQLDSSVAFVTNLAPGQKTDSTAVSFKDAPADAFTCRVTDVTRTASI